MTLGEKCAQSRKAKTLKQEDVASLICMSAPALSNIENDKVVPDLPVLIRLSKALDDPSILSFYCDGCPVRAEIFVKKFPSLNNIETNPMVIASKVKQELQEGIDALEPLLKRMLVKDFKESAEYQSTLEETFVQIVGTARSLEILKEQYMVQQILTPQKLRKIIDIEQDRCIQHGHHKPGRTGTEG